MGETADPREGEAFFLNLPEKLDQPFADLAWLREHRPVFFHAGLNQWFVFRYDDVVSLFHDARLSADRMKGFVDAAPEGVRDELRSIAPFLETWLLMKDGADHDRLRTLLHRGFSGKAVAGLRQPIQRATDALLARLEGRDRFDACGELAFLLPAYVLSDFLGVHEADRDRVVQWSVDFVDFFNVVPITAETTRRMVDSTNAMVAYTRDLLAERRATPQDDFLGGLARAEAEGVLSEDEIVGNVMLLLIAGHVAVRNLIGNLLHLLFTHPDQMAALRADPGLIHNAVEEALRYEPPVTMIPRVALEDMELRGQTIRAGQIVQLNLAAANRDPAYVADPERFDITRKPSRHMSFAVGAHACLGGLLAREQTRIVLETLFRQMPGLRLDAERPIEWYRNAGNRGPITLPVRR
jgi:cytochrome P450